MQTSGQAGSRMQTADPSCLSMLSAIKLDPLLQAQTSHGVAFCIPMYNTVLRLPEISFIPYYRAGLARMSVLTLHMASTDVECAALKNCS